MALLPVAQAEVDERPGVFVAAGGGRWLEGRSSAALTWTGGGPAAEAGALLPGGSIHQFELGLRGDSATPGAGFTGRRVGREIGVFLGIRAEPLAPGAGWLGLQPILRAGVGLSAVRDLVTIDRAAFGLAPLEIGRDRVALGPHLGVGLARAIDGETTIAVTALARAFTAPVVTWLGLAVVLSTHALP